MLCDLTQRDLSKALLKRHRVKLSQPQISRLERGGAPSYNVARAIAKELGTTPDDLFPGDGGEELRKRLKKTLGLKRRRGNR
jgi:transcriptional regulator with XRE-family HTH domain